MVDIVATEGVAISAIMTVENAALHAPGRGLLHQSEEVKSIKCHEYYLTL